MEIDLREVSGVKGDYSEDDGEEEKQICDNCKKTDYEEATAVLFCITCEEKLCPSCETTHAQVGEHLVVTLTDQNESKKFKESDFCTDHDEKLAELFCACCKKVICAECEKESHSSHNCSGVNDVADLVSKQAEAEYESLFVIQNHFDKEREKLSNEKIKVLKTVKEMKKDIGKRCDEITEFVRMETNALLKELDVFANERLEEIEMEKRKMEEHIFTFEKFKEYCDLIKSNINPRYTCEAEGVLRDIADDLKNRPEGRWKIKLFPIECSIQNTEIEQVLTSLSDAVGKLIIECQYDMSQSCEVELDEEAVFGMARLHDKLYVLSNSISIRRLQDPFVSVGKIEIPEVESPNYIVSCSKTSCLYILDKDADCSSSTSSRSSINSISSSSIWKVYVSDHRVSRWLDKVKELNAFNVTANAELVMLRNSTPVCLEVYNEYAILKQRCCLSETIPLLRRVCETPSGKFIGMGENSMYMFTRNGSIISHLQISDDPEFRGEPQCFDLSPYHIFLQCGSTDNNLGSISALTLELAYNQILVDESDGWTKPVASYYIKETKQLLIVEEVVSNNGKTWNLRAYDVFPE